MNTLIIQYNPQISIKNKAEDIHHLLDSTEKHAVNQSAWPNKDYIGSCEFSVLYGDDAIAIKYFITEDEIRAVYNQTNDPVYKDTCVEFFVSVDNENYYNFEFNCNGVCLAQHGPDKAHRTFLPIRDIELIKTNRFIRFVNVGTTNLIHWELTVIIPFKAFSRDNIQSLKGKSLDMNFYKCGDDLMQPHYLSWNRIDTAIPDFHKPDFFGKGVFELS
ncbi:carbohydrate-binding family 9-like protein [Pseudopedobacter sp.]|uniref:carbohydrate-binding family 9-like protein n=1 Tax=Pseudopedobacter sp. TaxID=1936787 RepID=UPI00333E8765